MDLKKAYDSVPWYYVNAFGLHFKVGDTRRLDRHCTSFHADMKIKLKGDGYLLEEIDLQDGLSQGCGMALLYLLLNAYRVKNVQRVQERTCIQNTQMYTKYANVHKVQECTQST